METDEVILRTQSRIFPKVYENWGYYGGSQIFDPLNMGTLYITNKRIVFIADTQETIKTQFRDFFSARLEEVYGAEEKKSGSISGRDINIYVQSPDEKRYTVSFVIPEKEEDEGVYTPLSDIFIDDLGKLKKNPRYYHSKVKYVRRNIWIKYMLSPQGRGGKMISDSEGLETCIVEDVFVIYKDGLLIKHETWKRDESMDDDIFSGMVMTLQDFIRDTFTEEKEISLKEVDLGNFKIFIERGEHIFLIVVYTGKINDKVRERVKSSLSEIEGMNATVLEDWDGDVEAVRGVDEILNRLFQ